MATNSVPQPRNVRNFWIEAWADDRQIKLGPRSKSGELHLTNSECYFEKWTDR
jgi:hypothetical protein